MRHRTRREDILRCSAQVEVLVTICDEAELLETTVARMRTHVDARCEMMMVQRRGQARCSTLALARYDHRIA